jgi:hypothetical protein
MERALKVLLKGNTVISALRPASIPKQILLLLMNPNTQI